MNRLPRTVLSLALLQAIALPSAFADADMDRYAASAYAYCDVVMLAHYWNQSADEAKATIGRKLGWGNESIIQKNLADARRRGDRCEFQHTDFDFDDAKGVAALWGVSIGEAKSSLAEKVSLGALDNARNVVREARASLASAGTQNRRDNRAPTNARNNRADRNSRSDPPSNRRGADDEGNLQRYAASKYEYCDALILGAFWGQSVGEAKATIGHKLAINFVEDVEESLRIARIRDERCEFQDTGFEVADAVALAGMWETNVNEAKTEIADMVSMGSRDEAQDLIVRAREIKQRRSRSR